MNNANYESRKRYAKPSETDRWVNGHPLHTQLIGDINWSEVMPKLSNLIADEIEQRKKKKSDRAYDFDEKTPSWEQ